jgi:hypothetical protein
MGWEKAEAKRRNPIFAFCPLPVYLQSCHHSTGGFEGAIDIRIVVG